MFKTCILIGLVIGCVSIAIAGDSSSKYYQLSESDLIKKHVLGPVCERIFIGSGSEENITSGVSKYRIDVGGYCGLGKTGDDVIRVFYQWCVANGGSNFAYNPDIFSNYLKNKIQSIDPSGQFTTVDCMIGEEKHLWLVQTNKSLVRHKPYTQYDKEGYIYVVNNTSIDQLLAEATRFNEKKTKSEQLAQQVSNQYSQAKATCEKAVHTKVLSEIKVGERLYNQNLVIDKKGNLIQVQTNYGNETLWIPIKEIPNNWLFPPHQCLTSK